MNKKDTLAVNTGLIAGRILIEGGSEMERINKTIKEIVNKASDKESQVFTSLTAIMVGVQDSSTMMFEQVEGRGINLEKIYQVDLLVKSYLNDEISLDDLYKKLKYLEKNIIDFSFATKVLAAAVQSAFLMIIFTQSSAYLDMFWTALTGACGYALAITLHKYTNIPFIREFLGSLLLGYIALIGVRLNLASSINDVIIGAVMPLVPGVSITNSIRDLIEGNLISGIERGVEATLTIFAIVSALALVLQHVNF
ncbi:threonine/serine exporter family protein [Streptococcaceae bacterium ESL0729]|nr:threonine/serine exporter family protein [Streptococcaceae bacterium ESL0729]